MSLAFGEYLAAKFLLDERSLNREVAGELRRRLDGMARLRALDLGTGRGAVLQRLVTADLKASMRLTGLDREPALLNLARGDLAACLRERGFRIEALADGLRGERDGQVVEVDLIDSALFDFAPPPNAYDLVTAHAFMDIVPLEPAVNRLARWLKPGGLFYATLNYDGSTTVFPRPENAAFEARLLACYDASMEARRVQGLATGGSRCGQRLHAELEAFGFTVIGYGSSDWNITPCNGRYRDGDEVCLRAMLDFIEGEGRAGAGIDGNHLAAWYRSRLDQLKQRRLGIIVHQIDLLAERG